MFTKKAPPTQYVQFYSKILKLFFKKRAKLLIITEALINFKSVAFN